MKIFLTFLLGLSIHLTSARPEDMSQANPQSPPILDMPLSVLIAKGGEELEKFKRENKDFFPNLEVPPSQLQNMRIPRDSPNPPPNLDVPPKDFQGELPKVEDGEVGEEQAGDPRAADPRALYYIPNLFQGVGSSGGIINIPDSPASPAISNTPPHHLVLPIVEVNPCAKLGFKHSGSKCLKVLPTFKSTWDNANYLCKKENLNMLEIKEGDDYVDLVAFLKTNGLQEDSFWVGARNWSSRWDWSTGYKEIPEFFWAPSFHGTEMKRDTHLDPLKVCAYIDHKRFHFMNADHCSSGKRVICETNANSYNGYLHNQRYSRSALDTSQEMHLCPPEWTMDEENSRCYKLEHDEMSFNGALKTCRNQASELATPSSLEENDFVQALLDESVTDDESLWIGLSLRDEDFVWVDGKPFGFSRWKDNEPNNHLHNIERCVDFSKETGEWSDVFCGLKKKFICERPAATLFPKIDA